MSGAAVSKAAQNYKPASGEDFRWWSSDDDEEIWQRVNNATKRISERTRIRRDMAQHYAEMYGSTQLAGLSPQNYEADQDGAYSPSTLSFNVVRRTIDAVTGKTAKNKPLPMYLTQKGDPAQQAKAKKRNRFIDGSFYETKQYKRSKLIARDAGTWGTACQSNYVRDGKICSERVYALWELRVDPHECMYGAPRTIYQYRWVDRFVLADRFPEHKEWIITEAVCTSEDEQWIGYDTTADQLLLKEAWHLPSGRKSNDGMHVAMVEGKTLFREEYKRDYFPFSFLHYKEPLIGFYGTGIAQELQGIQFEINAMAEKAQEAFLITGSYWWLPDGCRVPTAHLDNGMGTALRGGDTQPVKYDPPAISQDHISYLQMLRDAAPQETGMSGLSMAGEKPAGLNSGKALETYNDIESEAFVLFGQAYEEFHIDVAKQYIDLAREMGGYEVRSVSGKKYEVISIKDADFSGEDDYVMQCFPTSFLANTPADRFQQVQDLQNAGYLTPDQAKALLQFPDIESEADLDTAPHRVLIKWLTDMVETKKVREPESLMNFADALPTAIKFYWKCQDDEQPEETLDLVRTFIVQLQQLKNPPVEQQAPVAAPGALMPGGVVAPGAPVPMKPANDNAMPMAPAAPPAAA